MRLLTAGSLVRAQQGEPEKIRPSRKTWSYFFNEIRSVGTSEILLRNMKYASRMKYAYGI